MMWPVVTETGLGTMTWVDPLTALLALRLKSPQIFSYVDQRLKFGTLTSFRLVISMGGNEGEDEDEVYKNHPKNVFNLNFNSLMP